MGGPRHRPALAGSAFVAAGCVLASCGGGSPPAPPHEAARTTTTSVVATTTSVAPPTTTAPLKVAVPDVVGLKIKVARSALRGAGFLTVPFNSACNMGTLLSQSVVAALSVPGRPPDVKVGAVPLAAGTELPKGSQVGITWSGCYPDGSPVPLVTGRTFAQATKRLHLAGLGWACFSVGAASTTTTSSGGATTTSPSPSPATPTTAPRAPRVLSQATPAGTVVRAGSVIDFDMHHCPQ